MYVLYCGVQLLFYVILLLIALNQNTRPRHQRQYTLLQVLHEQITYHPFCGFLLLIYCYGVRWLC